MKIDFAILNTGRDDGEYVVYDECELFVAGEYPDKHLSVTEEELQKLQNNFSGPAHLDIEHIPTVLDGKLGFIESIKAIGKKLFACIRIPKWLDVSLDDSARRKLSVEISLVDGKVDNVIGAALVLNPRVKSAALMSAVQFKKYTWDGKYTLQQVHDLCASSGAVCSEKETVKYHTSEELQMIQKLHDMATKSGAKCTVWEDEDKKETKKKMSFMDKMKALFAEHKDDPETKDLAGIKEVAGIVADPLIKMESVDFSIQLAETNKALTDLQGKLATSEATLYFNQLLISEKVVPTEKDDVIKGLIKFSSDPDSLEIFKKSYESRNGNKLLTETSDATLFRNKEKDESLGADKAPDKARINELLNMSVLGREVLKDKERVK